VNSEMKKSILNITLTFFATFIVCNSGFCLDAVDIVKLSNAGVNDETIQTIKREKIIETCAFTVQEILELKGAGLSNATIRKVLESASFMKDAEPIEYGKDIRPIKFSSVKDIIDLKQAGISDEVIQAIVSGTKEVHNQEEYNRAWKMLENMGIIIDKTGKRPRVKPRPIPH
jgi:hypothetical protein